VLQPPAALHAASRWPIELKLRRRRARVGTAAAFEAEETWPNFRRLLPVRHEKEEEEEEEEEEDS
jgi:hypothetical protein